MTNYFKVSVSALGLFVIAMLVVVGPWPDAEDTYPASTYAVDTFANIQKLATATTTSPLQAGWGETDITPPVDVPLGGYSARHPKENQGAREKLFAKALTIKNNERDVTFLSGDFLLPLPELVDAVVATTGLRREQIYFAATHTHSGPGGYTREFVQQYALGAFNGAYFDRLVKQLSQAVNDSRSTLQNVRLEYAAINPTSEEMPDLVSNHLGKVEDTYAMFHRLSVINKDTQTVLCHLVSFSAHPTIWGRINHSASGDYPRRLQETLEQRWRSKVMFAIGAPGGLIPPPTPIAQDTLAGQEAYLNEYSQRITNWVVNAFSDATRSAPISPTIFESIAIDNYLIPVELPPTNYRIVGEWRLSPLLVNLLFHNRETYVHHVRLGNLFFFAYPADFAGEIAHQLDAYAKTHSAHYWPTSFNGDYIGYLSSSTLYLHDQYETHDVNFFGPWTGDYFAEISRRVIQKHKAGDPTM